MRPRSRHRFPREFATQSSLIKNCNVFSYNFFANHVVPILVPKLSVSRLECSELEFDELECDEVDNF